MDSISLKAYKIFVEELEKQREVVEMLLGRQGSFTHKELEDLRILFHRIKGGGGFFGLTELSAVAGALEEVVLENGCNPEKIQELTQNLLAKIKLVKAAP